MIAALLAATVVLAAQMSHGMVKPPLTHGALPSLPGPARESEGEQVYRAQCAYCHGVHLQGTAGPPVGGSPVPPLIGVGAAAVDFMLSTGRMPLELPGSEPMRAQQTLTPEQVRAVTGYIVAHGGAGPPIPLVHPSNDLPRGRALYEDNCQQCHGATGSGNAAGFGWMAPLLRQSTPEQIAEAVRIGPGIMPHYDPHQISPSDLDAIVAYVSTFDTKNVDRGGWTIGGFGPVGEGIVAWILGLGGTVLVMRRIGEKL